MAERRGGRLTMTGRTTPGTVFDRNEYDRAYNEVYYLGHGEGISGRCSCVPLAVALALRLRVLLCCSSRC